MCFHEIKQIKIPSEVMTAELIHAMQQVTMATENLRKRFDQMLKTKLDAFANVVSLLITFFKKVNFFT